MARLAEAESVFAGCIPGWRTLGQPTLTAWIVYQLGQVQRAWGRLDAAVETFQRALHADTAAGRESAPTAGPTYVGLAEVAYQRNDLDLALLHVTDGIALCRQFFYKAPLAAGLAMLAWIRQATGDPAGALEAIYEASEVSQTAVGPLNPVPAQRARLLLAQGNLLAAAGFVQQYDLGADDEPDFPREPGQLMLARVLLAEDRPDRALHCWTGWTRLRPPRTAPAASSRPARCARWRWRPQVMKQTRSLPSPRRSCWPARKATCGSSPTRGRRWPRCSGGSSRPGAPARRPPTSRPATWPRSSVPSAPGLPFRFRPGHRRGARHRRSADQPRAGGASDAGAGQVESGHRRRARGQPGHASRSTWAICWVSSARPTAPRPSPGPVS